MLVQCLMWIGAICSGMFLMWVIDLGREKTFFLIAHRSSFSDEGMAEVIKRSHRHGINLIVVPYANVEPKIVEGR